MKLNRGIFRLPIFVAILILGFSIQSHSKQNDDAVIESARAFRQHVADVFVAGDIDQVAAVLHPDAIIKLSGANPIVGKEAANAFYAFFFDNFRVVSAPLDGDGVWYVSKNGQMVITTFHQIVTLEIKGTCGNGGGGCQTMVLDIEVTQTYEKASKNSNNWLIVHEHNATPTPLL